MSHDDLALLLNTEVTATEPHHSLDARVPVRLGRVRLRARRVRSGAAVAVAVVAAGVAVPLVADGTASTPTTTPAPVSTSSAGARVRAALEERTGPLGDLSVRRVAGATTYTLRAVDGGWRTYTVTIDPSGALAEPEEVCRSAQARGYLSCEVDRSAGGEPVVVESLAVVPVGNTATRSEELGVSTDDVYARVPVRALDAVDPADRFARLQATTGTITVSELIDAPDPAMASWTLTPADLVALATDPELDGSH